MRVNSTIPTFSACSDVWETGFIRQLSGSLTFHVFETPPTKVYVLLSSTSFFQQVLILALDLTLDAVRTFYPHSFTTRIYNQHRFWLLDT